MQEGLPDAGHDDPAGALEVDDGLGEVEDGGEEEEDCVEIGGANVGAEVPGDVGVGSVGAGHFVKRDKGSWGVKWESWILEGFKWRNVVIVRRPVCLQMRVSGTLSFRTGKRLSPWWSL